MNEALMALQIVPVYNGQSHAVCSENNMQKKLLTVGIKGQGSMNNSLSSRQTKFGACAHIKMFI